MICAARSEESLWFRLVKWLELQLRALLGRRGMLAASFVRLKENKNNGKRRCYWPDLKKRGKINIHAEMGSRKTKCKCKVILSAFQNNEGIKSDSTSVVRLKFPAQKRG